MSIKVYNNAEVQEERNRLGLDEADYMLLRGEFNAKKQLVDGSWIRRDVGEAQKYSDIFECFEGWTILSLDGNLEQTKILVRLTHDHVRAHQDEKPVHPWPCNCK